MSDYLRRMADQLERHHREFHSAPVLDFSVIALRNGADRIEELERLLKQERKAHEKEVYVWQENYAALEAENARLREAQTRRPIETAPRDGTEILGLFPEGPADLDGTVCLMWWYQAPPWRPDDSGWETHWGFNGDESGPTHWWPRAALQEGEG